MGFLSGSLTYERYWITTDPTGDLGDDHLTILDEHQIGAVPSESAEQPQVGFIGGSHLLDTQFDFAKNIFGDAMHFGIRIDTNQIPSAIRNAWLQIELAALSAENASGRPTKKQRQEAKESVEARCQEEAATGKYRRMQQVPVLWDAADATIYLGGTSPSANELCVNLLERAFGLELERVTSSKLAKAFAEETKQLDSLYQLSPAPFLPDSPCVVHWWNGMAENYDYLGNEFLLWLWCQVETKSDTIKLKDDSSVSAMFARTLTLDCPLGESGKESISADSPIVLPEAALAIRSGKLPRKCGLTLVRHDEQYDLALQAEAFTVGSGKITHIGGKEESSDNPELDRIARLREMTSTIDLLFHEFCDRRIGKNWRAELKKMQEWLSAEKPQGKRKPAA